MPVISHAVRPLALAMGREGTLDTFFSLCDNSDMHKMSVYRIYPTKKQAKALNDILHECRWLYNHLLEKRKNAAEEAGRMFVKVNPAYTSQDCSRCGHRQNMPLSDRVYECPCCGLIIDRDLNASKNILAVGLHSIGSQPVEAPAERLRE